MTADNVDAEALRRERFYGRRRGRRLRPKRQRLLDSLLPRVAIDLPGGDGPLDLRRAFGREPDRLWLEIGFGGGEHLALQARMHPDVLWLACEPYLDGVAKLLEFVAATEARNIRILADDARPLIRRLPEACLGRVFVLFPDPWPKARHVRRRIVSPATVAGLARAMRDGAELRLATDHPDYLGWMLRHVRMDGSFEWLARRPADWRSRPDDWPETRYERKALAKGIPCTYLRFRRVARRPAADRDAPGGCDKTLV